MEEGEYRQMGLKCRWRRKKKKYRTEEVRW